MQRCRIQGIEACRKRRRSAPRLSSTTINDATITKESGIYALTFTRLSRPWERVAKVGMKLMATTILAPNIAKAARVVPESGARAVAVSVHPAKNHFEAGTSIR